MKKSAVCMTGVLILMSINLRAGTFFAEMRIQEETNKHTLETPKAFEEYMRIEKAFPDGLRDQIAAFYKKTFHLPLEVEQETLKSLSYAYLKAISNYGEKMQGWCKQQNIDPNWIKSFREKFSADLAKDNLENIKNCLIYVWRKRDRECISKERDRLYLVSIDYERYMKRYMERLDKFFAGLDDTKKKEYTNAIKAIGDYRTLFTETSMIDLIWEGEFFAIEAKSNRAPKDIYDFFLNSPYFKKPFNPGSETWHEFTADL